MPTWNTAADWAAARAESGVIHRDFGTRVASKLAMGPDPGLPLRDWFGAGTSQPYVQIMQHTAVYDSTANKTFIAWQGPIMRPQITYYDHAAGAWGPIVEVSTVALSNDDHGAPALCQDASGYLHIFWGSHNNAVEYAISTTARDISAWTVQADVTGNWSYQQAFVIGGNIWLFGREEPSLGATYNITVKSSNGVATGHTWNALIALTTFTDDMTYPSAFQVSGTDVRMAFWNRLDPAGNSQHIYYAVYETATGLLKNAAGTSSTLPISLATANSNFRVFNSGTDQANAPCLWFDTSGNPHIAFIHDVAGTGTLKHTRWNGTAWTTPVALDSPVALWANPAAIIASDTSGTLYYAVAGAIKKVAWSPSDDTSIVVTTFQAKAAWSPGNLNLFGPIAVPNAHANLRLLIAEIDDANYNYELCRIGAWGDSGYLKADAVRHEHSIVHPLNDASGATTLLDLSGHRQVLTKGSLVSGVAAPLSLTGIEFASTREGTIAHTTNQWFFGGNPCTVRFVGNGLSGPVLSKGRSTGNLLRYMITVSTTGPALKVLTKNTASFKTAESSTLPALAGIHLYEIVWDGAGTLTFRSDGAARGTSAVQAVGDFSATPTNPIDVGYWYNSGSDAAAKAYGAGVLMYLEVIPRYQSTLAEHQAFWNAFSAGSFTSAWKAA